MKSNFLPIVLSIFAVLGVTRDSMPGAVVGVDGLHGSYYGDNFVTGSYYDEFRSAVTTAGLSSVALRSFRATDLAGLDAAILKQSPSFDDIYSREDAADLQEFVRQGHGLLLIAEGGYRTDDTVDNFNSLAGLFGVTFAPGCINPAGFTVQGFVPHEVTLGISQVGVDYYRPILSLTNPAVDLTLLSGENDILAVADGGNGAGNVVLVSDASLWMDPGLLGVDRSITFGNNRLLLQNILSVIAPRSLPSLQAQPKGEMIRLSWLAKFAGYHLEWAVAVAPANWQTATNEVSIVGDSLVIWDEHSASQRFYRLAK